MKTRFVTRGELRYSIRCLEHALTERNAYVRDLEASLAVAERRAERAEQRVKHLNALGTGQLDRAAEAEAALAETETEQS